jgi:hypothetical protein
MEINNVCRLNQESFVDPLCGTKFLFYTTLTLDYLNNKSRWQKKTIIPCESPFPTAKQDTASVSYDYGTPQSHSPSYRLAYADFDFIMRDDLRPMRLQLELFKPEILE